MNITTTSPKSFLLIIGAMKSGTTYLFDLLKQHPEISGCIEKEPCFFSDARHVEQKWDFGMPFYDSLWPEWDPEKHKYALEASVNYTKLPFFPNAAERIYSIKDRSFKFIYIIRNPIERIQSHLSYMTVVERRQGKTDSQFFQAIDEESVYLSKYAYQLDEYSKRFGKESIKIVFFEDLIEKRQEVISEICSFLEIDDFKPDPDGDKNTTKDYAFLPIVYKIRQLIPTSIPLKNYIPKMILNSFKDKNLESFCLTENQRSFLVEELKDDLKVLRDEYNVDIDRWELGID